VRPGQTTAGHGGVHVPVFRVPDLVYRPEGVSFHAAEEVFNVLVSDEEGLGALDVTDTAAGRGLARYHLAVAQNLRMFFRQAKNAVQTSDRDAYVWERARALAHANQGQFDQVIPVAMPEVAGASLPQIFGDVDQNGKTRLVVLDPRRWTLHNGRDTSTRTDVAALLGVGEQALPVDNGASCIVACVNTQRRDNVRKRVTEVLAWRAVIGQLDSDDDKRRDALAELRSATERVDSDLLKAFQHFAHLTRTDRVEVDWQRFDDDTKSSLKGSHVWDALVNNGRAVYPGKLSGDYLRTLLAKMPRALTLKEIGQQFYKNAAFPMVPSSDDIRRAVFQTLTGPDAYEVVDGNGEALTSRPSTSCPSAPWSFRCAKRPASQRLATQRWATQPRVPHRPAAVVTSSPGPASQNKYRAARPRAPSIGGTS
jgi:hypothetical protein